MPLSHSLRTSTSKLCRFINDLIIDGYHACTCLHPPPVDSQHSSPGEGSRSATHTDPLHYILFLSFYIYPILLTLDIQTLTKKLTY